MKKDSSIRDAIDESLSSVRFNAQDERSVIRNIRYEKTPAPQKKRGFRLDFAFALSMVLVLVIPLTVFTLRAPRVVSLSDTGTPVLQTAKPSTVQPTAAPTRAPNGVISESAAIQAAKACYSSVCDTSVFSFEEFTVTCTLSSDNRQYDILMQSIYGNGCTFYITVDATSGGILQSSEPEKATCPDKSALESDKAQAWYQKNGQYIFTWSASTQAEFSRRYAGALLREPRSDEISFKQAAALAESVVPNSICYPMLFSERAAKDGVARYKVFCLRGEILEDTLPDGAITVVTLSAATGDIESISTVEPDSLSVLTEGL